MMSVEQISGTGDSPSPAKKKSTTVPLNCPFCGSILSRRDKLVYHIKHQHAEKEFPSYLISDRKRSSIEKPLNDVKVIKSVFPCSKCGEVFKSKTTLDDHVKSSHIQKESSTVPEQNDKIVETSSNSLDAKLTSNGVVDKTATNSKTQDESSTLAVQCAYCQGMFATKKTLRVHIKRLHPEKLHLHTVRPPPHPSTAEEVKTTPAKPKATAAAAVVNQSTETQTPAEGASSDAKKGNRRKPKPCPHCDAVLSRSDGLRAHIKAKHPDVQLPPPGTAPKSKSESSSSASSAATKSKEYSPSPCPYCPVILGRKSRVKRHIIRKHPDKPVIESPVKRPTSTESPKTEKVSGSRMPTPCPYCPKILGRPSRIKPHVMKVHPGMKVPAKITVTTSTETAKKESKAEKKSQSTSATKKGGKDGQVAKKKDEKDSKGKSSKDKKKKQKEKDKKKKGKNSAAAKKGGGHLNSKEVVNAAWKQVWSSNNPVYLRFNFSRRSESPRKGVKRERTDSEHSLDLETLFATPYASTTNTPTSSVSASTEKAKPQVVLKKCKLSFGDGVEASKEVSEVNSQPASSVGGGKTNGVSEDKPPASPFLGKANHTMTNGKSSEKRTSSMNGHASPKPLEQTNRIMNNTNMPVTLVENHRKMLPSLVHSPPKQKIKILEAISYK